MSRISRFKFLVLFMLLAAIGLGACGGRQGASTATGPTPTPKPVSDLDYLAMMKVRKEAIKIADWEQYRDTLIGERIQWTGYVLYIVESKENKGQYDLQVDMDPPDALFRNYDVVFPISQEQADSLQKDQEITFQGDIKAITELSTAVDIVVNVELENVIIMP